MARQLSSLEHAWPLCDECVTAFQRPPRGDLWRLGESVLRSRVSYPPAPPKAPPRGCSRAVSCVGRPTHQDEPQAPWRACSGRYAAVGVKCVPSRQTIQTTPTQHIRVLGSSFRCLNKEDKRSQRGAPPDPVMLARYACVVSKVRIIAHVPSRDRWCGS